jgi:hypothetical protein
VVAPAVGPTRLMANIVGPLYRLKKNEYKAPYDGNSDVLITFTVEPNTEFDESYVSFKLRTLYGTEYDLPIVKYDLSSYPSVATDTGISVTVGGGIAVRPDDFIEITDPIPLRGKYKVTAVTFDGTKYTITLDNSSWITGYNNCSVKAKVLVLNPVKEATAQYRIKAYQGLNEHPVSTPFTGVTATLSTTDNTILTFASADDIKHIIDGDTVYITSSTDTHLAVGSYKITRKPSDRTLTIKHVAGVSGSSTVEGYFIYGSSVPTGKIYSNSRALDKSQTDIITINSIQDLENRFGEVDLDNPLVFGVYMAMINGATPCYAQAIPSNDESGYAAVTDIWDKRDFYVVAPLTDSDVVINNYHNKAVALSAPDVAKWKRVVAGKSIPKITSIFTGDSTNISDGLVNNVDNSSFNVTFTSTTNIPWDKVVVNKTKFKISNCSDPHFNGEYLIIASSPADRKITCSGAIGKDQTTLTFDCSLINPMSTEEQVDTLASYGEIYASRLISIIVGDVYTSINGVNTPIPTYYAAAGLAGMVEGYAPHVQFNGYPIAGIVKVENTWDIFNEDQLSTIAGGGVIILVQKTPTSQPYIRNQLTTDVSDLLKRSLSVVKSVDYFKRLIYDNVVDFLKGWNVVTEAIEGLQMKIQAVINFARTFNVPKAGTLITAGGIAAIIPEDNAIRIKIDATFPKPLENIKFELYIS